MDRLSIGDEVVVSSGSANANENSVVWNPKTGHILTAFRGGSSASRGLSLVGTDYVVSALADAPLLMVWHWRKTDHAEKKIVLPGVATALAVTKSGHHCVVGISSKIYVWHVVTGNLLKVIDFHTFNILCLKISRDERFIVSVSERESRVVVWSFLQVINDHSQHVQPRPLYTFHDHSSFISDVYISTIGYSTKVVSCAKDHTCFVYDLSTGRAIFSVFGDTHFTKVLLDPCEFYMYLGTLDGDVCVIEFHKYLSMGSVDVSDDKLIKWSKHHSKAITCLDLSSDSKYLLSGCVDGMVRVWMVSSGKNICTYKHEGTVTNAFFARANSPILGPLKGPTNIVFQNLKKFIEDANLETEMVSVKLSSRIPGVQVEEPTQQLVNSVCFRDFYTDLHQREGIEEELEKCRGINEHFYSFVLGTCVNNFLNDEIEKSE